MFISLWRQCSPPLRHRPDPPGRNDEHKILERINKPAACQNVMALTLKTSVTTPFHNSITIHENKAMAPMTSSGMKKNGSLLLFMPVDLVVKKIIVKGLQSLAQVLHGITFTGN